MQILLDSTVPRVAEPASAVESPKVPVEVSVPVSDPSSTTPTAKSNPATVAPASKSETLLTFQRDPAGRFYYVITDAQTGQEIAQVPPEQLRNVGEGIDAFLKHLDAEHAASSHIAIKA